MKKTLTALLLLLPTLTACSKLPGFSDCNEAVDNNLLQETVEKNLRSVLPHHPLEIGFCLKDMKNQYCDIQAEVSDIKEVSKNSFSTSCKAMVRYSATLRPTDRQKDRQAQIDAINKKAAADLTQAKDYTIRTFQEYGVAYSEADLKEGIAKREAAVKAAQEEALKNVMPEQPSRQSYYLVLDAAYTVSTNKDYVNLNLDDLNLVAQGE